jgi:pimeloyl-ACP methyl ester carboxylesterase
MDAKYLETAGGRIAYELWHGREAGAGAGTEAKGPLVVCVPSMGDLRGEYRFLAPALAAAGYRVAAMDVRGHGESTTGWDDYSVAGVGSDVVALVQALGGPAVVIGESMAAGAAVWAAAEAPALIEGLVLIGPFVRGETSRAAALLYGALFARPWGPAVWQRYYTGLYRTRKPADFAEYTAALRSNLAEKGRLEALQQMLAASKAASEQRLGAVKAPVLVLMGTKDPDFKAPAAEARFVAEALGGALHMVEGAGHYPQAEMPEVVAPLVLDFLAAHHGVPVRA